MTSPSRAALAGVRRIVGSPHAIASPCRAFHLTALRVAAGKSQAIVSGRGLTRATADIRCLGEAAEFLSLCWGDEVRLAHTPKSMSIGIGEALGIDAAQLPVCEHALPVVPVTPLNGGTATAAAATFIYHGHPDGVDDPRLALADSNGAAAGRTPANAVRAALFELVERDAVAIWWYNELRRPPIDRAARDHRAIHRLAFDLARRDRLLLLIDLTHDLGVPVAAAVSAKNDGSQIAIGTAAAATIGDAVLGAAGELVQILYGIEGVVPDGSLGERELRALQWLQGATLRDCAHLIPSRSAPAAPPAPRPSVKGILSRLKALGIHVYAHDATRPDIGVPVIKLVAPGLRHTKPRFGPGRLFDVPVSLGWCARPTPFDQLNPWPWPF